MRPRLVNIWVAKYSEILQTSPAVIPRERRGENLPFFGRRRLEILQMSEVEAAPPRPKLVVAVPCVCMLGAWSKFQDGNLVGCPAAGPTARLAG